jgi:hypothetical protein
VAHNKIGSGSGWQGYYMFAGGTNPPGGLQESQATGYPNDLPVLDYDFHAPIGAAGRLTSGFVFITWHQPHIPLPDYPAAQFRLALAEETVSFPHTPLAIPAGTIAHWPVNLEIGGVRLRWATASPLTVLGPDSSQTLVLTAEEGIEVQLCLAEGTSLDGAATPLGGNAYSVESRQPVTLTATSGGHSLKILVLPSRLADQAWVLETADGRELVISGDPVWVAADGGLTGRSLGSPEVTRYSAGSRRFEKVVTAGVDAGQPRLRVAAELLRAGMPVPASFGSLAGRAAAPSDDVMDGLAAVYRLDLAAASTSGGGHTELEIAWAGDVARLFVDGTLVADRFWDGSPWVIEMHDAGIGAGSEVLLQILPLSKAAEVGLPAAAQERRDSVGGDLVSLDAVELIRWTAWTEERTG